MDRIQAAIELLLGLKLADAVCVFRVAIIGTSVAMQLHLRFGFPTSRRAFDATIQNLLFALLARRVFQMGHASSACPNFEEIFPSGLFDGLGGEDSTPALATAHPCGGLARRQCRDKFLAAMQGVGED